MSKNGHTPQCELGAYVVGKPEADNRSGLTMVQVDTDFEIKESLARYLRRNGRTFEGVECGCTDREARSFTVLLDNGTDIKVIFDLMATLEGWTGELPLTPPVLAPSSPLHDERSHEAFLERTFGRR